MERAFRMTRSSSTTKIFLRFIIVLLRPFDKAASEKPQDPGQARCLMRSRTYLTHTIRDSGRPATRNCPHLVHSAGSSRPMANPFYSPGDQRAARVNELFAAIAPRYE